MIPSAMREHGNPPAPMQMVSLRLPPQLIADLKLIAQSRGQAYQTMAREVMETHASDQLKGYARANAPCGRCMVGFYSEEAMATPTAEAIRQGAPLPRCKTADRECIGARDFLATLPNTTPTGDPS